ncbi:MAG: ABC transporter ATP-binding protein [Planctomycetes bacterium]|nr:ABC transporter ATP-binding protein [Planctomycetota bacterium]
MSAALELVGVTKRFGATLALDSIELSVGEREILVVLGPTGAGKTTLLRTIAGLETPDAGSVRFAGRDVTRATPSERDVALVFQNFSLYPSWTVRENLEFPLRAPGRALGDGELRARVETAAAMLRIPHLLDRAARHLSGGEMQRVAIGRAIVRRPKLFLMDEPLTNLDAKLREALRVELVELVRSLATPMVYVTHDQAEALSMGDRVAVLSHGRVLQAGDARSIYLAPKSPLVARQLGSPPINLFTAAWSDGWWRAADGVPLLETARPSATRATLGVRPEHVEPTGGPAAARVEVVEDTGPTRVLLLALGASHVHVVVPRSFVARVGEELRPRIDRERVVVWPADAPEPAGD